jgi:N-dimethylarginine dimethylaminohydrolase
MQTLGIPRLWLILVQCKAHMQNGQNWSIEKTGDELWVGETERHGHRFFAYIENFLPQASTDKPISLWSNERSIRVSLVSCLGAPIFLSAPHS